MDSSQSELLTRSGRGTAMGELMRQYWVPAVLSSLLKTDREPVRIMLLGEKLIAFRSTSGKVGVMDHRCPHRCASLFFGRNEEGGLRCAYHGWKFDTDGNCIEMPNVDPPPAKIRVKARAYRVVEKAGVVWVYMGDRKEPPPLPDFPVLSLPPDDIHVWCEQREANYLQCLEGEIDTSHASFLHLGKIDAQEGKTYSNMTSADTAHRAVRYKTAVTESGLLAAGYRPAGDEELYWRFAQFHVPFWTQPPPCELGTEAVARAWVPMDDTHTMLFAISTKTFVMSGHPDAILPPPSPGLTFGYEFMPNTTDWYGLWRPAQNAANDYRIDREIQRDGSYSGIEGLDIQDMAIQESMGAITDHAFENLVASDQAIAETRRRLLGAAMAWRDRREPPPGLENPDCYKTWSGFVTAPANVEWTELYKKSVPEGIQPKAISSKVAYGN